MSAPEKRELTPLWLDEITNAMTISWLAMVTKTYDGVGGFVYIIAISLLVAGRIRATIRHALERREAENAEQAKELVVELAKPE